MNAHPRPYYYLENFRLALAWLAERYGDLLSSEEREFITNFESLPLASSALLVRMLMRQGDLFRTSKLVYAEIGCPLQAARPLIELGWIDARPRMTLQELCRLLRKTELWHAFALTGEARAARKVEIPQVLGQRAAEVWPLEQWWGDAPDTVYRVSVAGLCERLRLMFFGNFRQSWAEFVLADLGIFRYEAVPIEGSARAFQHRDQIEQFHALYRCRELLHAQASTEQVCARLPPALPGCAWIEARRAKIQFHIAQRHEQARDLTAALAAYQDCAHPEARIRVVRVLERLGRIEDAVGFATRVQAMSASEFELQQLARILPRLHRKLGNPAMRASVPCGWEQLELSLPAPEGAQRVEQLVRDHLAAPDAPVVYAENGLLNSLFGLLCWKAIFAPVPGAFFHTFQAAPADLFDAQFATRRQHYFDACFAELESGAYRTTIREIFEQKAGIQSAFVAWGLLTRELLELALACLPAVHLHACFKRLLADLRTNRCGLPDLVQFWPREQRYRLIEVKGPGDRLQDNQLRWLRFCSTEGMPVAVCTVRWQAACA